MLKKYTYMKTPEFPVLPLYLLSLSHFLGTETMTLFTTFRILSIYEALPIMGLPVHFWARWNCDCLGIISLDAWKHSEKIHDSKACKITRHSEEESQSEVKPSAIHYEFTEHKARTLGLKAYIKHWKHLSWP